MSSSQLRTKRSANETLPEVRRMAASTSEVKTDGWLAIRSGKMLAMRASCTKDGARGVEPTASPAPPLSKADPRSQQHSQGHILPADFREVLDAWGTLTPPLRAAILALVRSARTGGAS